LCSNFLLFYSFLCFTFYYGSTQFFCSHSHQLGLTRDTCCSGLNTALGSATLAKQSIHFDIIYYLTERILTIYTPFHSVYKAVLVGLTLTAFPDEKLYIKIANLLGGIGGILIFFTSLSIVLQYFLVLKSRDELLRELARRFLESKSIESKNSPR